MGSGKALLIPTPKKIGDLSQLNLGQRDEERRRRRGGGEGGGRGGGGGLQGFELVQAGQGFFWREGWVGGWVGWPFIHSVNQSFTHTVQ